MQRPMTFFKTFLAAFLAFFVVLIVFAFIFGIGVTSAVMSGSKSETASVKDKSVLHLKLSGELRESAVADDFDFDKFFPGANVTKTIGLYQAVRAIEYAKTDDKIKGIYLEPDLTFAGGGWASLQSLRNALLDFKKSGKFILAYAQAYSEKSYYIASVADSVFLTPEGIMEFNGLVANPMFYTGMFEKLEIEPKIYRVGKFKSAVEPYFLKQMSEENKLQYKSFLDDLWGVFAEEVAASRKTNVEEINRLATNLVFADGFDAAKTALVDAVAYEDQIKDKLLKLSGLEKKDKLRLVALNKYQTNVKVKNENAKNKIAVIIAQGQINVGKSDDETIGSATLVKQLREAREDEKVKAVVLRVNSPGGSALASDEINREVELLKAVKPVVASMGDLAASGGYYISANADYIMAQPNTITGSIGIFGVLFNTQKLFNNKLGLTFDEVETHPNADFLNPNLPSDALHDSLMQRYVTKGYGNFLQIVKRGRKFADTLEVDKVGQGRVWSGKQAIGIKLIDGFGNLDSAVVKAASLANLGKEDYRVELVPKAKGKFEAIFDKGSDAVYQKALSKDPLMKEIEALRELKKRFPQNGMYMMMPETVDIH